MARPERDVHATVLNIIGELRGTDPLKELFWSQLNYERVNQTLSRRGWGKAANEALAEDPLLFASGGADEAFHVIYARLASEKLVRTPERPVVSRVLRDHPYALFVFSNEAQDRWHFLNVKYGEDAEKRRLFRRITVGPEERLRTASERLAMLDLATVGADLFGLSPLAIQSRHDEAFDVEAVTDLFFKGDPRTGRPGFVQVFKALQDDLEKQTRDRHWAHDYALQFLNRCMFLYFVQRKRWLGDDRDFLANFWKAYTASGQPKDAFFDRWLKVLFFEAFNDRFQAGRHKHLPEDIRDVLALAPYLNGGLFSTNRLDDEPPKPFRITDKRFKQVFDFLEHYNFTIAEDSPLDQEVAVDPEMIGKVYESLVNVPESLVDERGQAGIFYTPRTEIDLMCRLALVDNLANHLGDKHKNLFYEAVFALVPEEKEAADAALAKARLWPAVAKRLAETTVADPACGSGSFLVGMLHVLDDLSERANRALNVAEAPFDRKRRIIGQSLYGVDVMEWACHVAELRLWLALIIDAEFRCEELHCRKDPLLPHFTFKVRPGDSLFQEVGGINLGHRRGSHDIPKSVKARLRELQNAKVEFYSNVPQNTEKSKREIEHEEVAVFKDLLAEQVKALDEQAKKLKRQQAGQAHTQMRLDGSTEERSRQLELTQEKREREIERLAEGKDRLEAARRALRNVGQAPFVWDIAFAEVMESDKGGFDVVIGNPPYVRTQSISDPALPREKVTTENKKEYKAKLARSVYQAWPRFFDYRPSSETPGRKMDAKSDLYVYFYFHGLSLLGEEGSFCFITSNSWLDVGYGKDLQEFLLRHGHVRMVIDNQVKRSFASADVNTVIVLLARPDDRREDGPERAARFVMFKVPFDQVLPAVVFQEIEDARERKSTAEYRLCSLTQERLLEEGCEMPQEEDKPAEPAEESRAQSRGPLIKVANYVGNKWGGKYLRAPDIYFTVLDKGAQYIRRLGDCFEAECYLNTGGADGFFILTEVRSASGGCVHISNNNTAAEEGEPFSGALEKRYLVPLIKDYTKQDKRIETHGHDAYCLVVQDKPSRQLAEYIRWGEKQGYSKRSGRRGQRPWYRPNPQMLRGASILVPRSWNDTFGIFYNPRRFLSLRFYRLHATVCDDLRLAAYLNTTLIALVLETLGNKSLGQGVLDFYVSDFVSLRLPVVLDPALDEAFLPLRKRAALPVGEEVGMLDGKRKGGGAAPPQADRQELDGVVFDALKLTRGEREGVYEALLDLVEKRLSKATSLLRGG